jgi:hypothetical protein
MSALPAQAVPEFGVLVDELLALGWSVSRADYSEASFGNIVIDLSNGPEWLRLTRDRGDLLIDGPDHELLRAAGLCRAYHDADEFRAAVVGLVRRAAG